MDPDHLDWIRKHNEKVHQDREMDRRSWKQEPWYHGRLDRATTDTILVGRRAGMFLVRDSSTCPGDYVLSVSENNKVSHYIISRRGGLYLIGDQSFTDFPAVIDFYKKHFLDTTTLVEPAPNPRTPNNSAAPQSMGIPSFESSAPSAGGMAQPLAGANSLPPPVSVVGKLIVKGKFDFSSDDSEDLTFKKSDVMEVLRKDEDDWWFARHSDGREGSIPVPYVIVVEDNSSTSFKARALQDRECPYDPTALTFKSGDIITVTKQNENGMWEGELDGKTGHFPFKLVEVLNSH